jgi:hypothetical protein
MLVRKICTMNDKEDFIFSHFIRPRSVSSELPSERIVNIPVTLRERIRILESITV